MCPSGQRLGRFAGSPVMKPEVLHLRHNPLHLQHLQGQLHVAPRASGTSGPGGNRHEPVAHAACCVMEDKIPFF